MSKPDAKLKKSDRAVLENLGEMISGRIKKGMNSIGRSITGDEHAGRSGGRAAKFMGYVKVFLDDKAVAAVTPSSKYLVERSVRAMDLSHAKTIVEYGAAQGVMTRRIIDGMRPDARLVAIEFNAALFEDLKKMHEPRLVPIHGDVRDIERILSKQGIKPGTVDTIVSGVPFAFFSAAGRHELLKKTVEVLRPGGRFVAYQVTTHLIPILRNYFSDVDIQFEIRNIPPHFVFTAIK